MGSGTLLIEDGGRVENSLGAISETSNTNSLVTVRGVGSTWSSSGPLFVGGAGNGTLMIEDGGSVSNTNGTIGSSQSSNGVVTIDGAGSTWMNSGDLVVGEFGRGTLNITGGGNVSNTNGRIGPGTIDEGAVTVDGAGSTWTTTGSLTIGSIQRGTGSVVIGAGATVNVGGATEILRDSRIDLQGGVFSTGSLSTRRGFLAWESGTLNITGPAGVSLGSTPLLGDALDLGGNRSLVVAQRLTVEGGSQLSNNGGAVAAGSVQVDAGGVLDHRGWRARHRQWPAEQRQRDFRWRHHRRPSHQPRRF